MASPGTDASVPPSALAQVCPSPPSPGPGQRAPRSPGPAVTWPGSARRPSPGPGQRAPAPPRRQRSSARWLRSPAPAAEARSAPWSPPCCRCARLGVHPRCPSSPQLRPLHPLLARPEFATLCARTRLGFATDPSTRGVRRAGGGSILGRHAPNRRSRHLQRCCTRARVEVCPAQSERSREAATNSRFQRVPHPAISDVSSWVRQMSLQSRSDSWLAPPREGPGPTPSA